MRQLPPPPGSSGQKGEGSTLMVSVPVMGDRELLAYKNNLPLVGSGGIIFPLQTPTQPKGSTMTTSSRVSLALF